MTGKNEKPTAEKKIAKQKVSIETLKKLLTYYQEITDTIREPFIILDQKLHVVTANQAFYHVFKVTAAETEGRVIYKLGNNQWESLELRKLLEEILPERKVFNGFEVTHEFPEIGKKSMLLNARQVDHKQLILLAIEDVTGVKKLKADSEKMTANLKKQHRKLTALNDAKDEFIALASHQLRTPATIVKQYTSMLSEGYAGELSTEQTRLLDSAILSNERQLEIIEDLLRVARVDAGKVYLAKTSCNVREMVESVIKQQLVAFTARGQTVLVKKQSKDVYAYMDKKLMRMVVENLLDNASKYSEDGKQITVQLSEDSKYINMIISDDGIGILKKDLSRLFKKFSRIDNPLSLSSIGTGLGLYWVKKIVDLHGGTIKVDSTSDKGTIFTVSIPRPDATKNK